jgi:hypothetical protein
MNTNQEEIKNIMQSADELTEQVKKINKLIEEKEFLISKLTICDTFTNEWVTRLQKEILILKEIK